MKQTILDVLNELSRSKRLQMLALMLVVGFVAAVCHAVDWLF